jgi:hypothetical protein
MLIKLIERVQRRETRILLRISLICAFRIFSRFRTAFDGRRSTQAWLQNLAPFQVFVNTSVFQDIQDKTLTIYINFGKFKLEKAPNFVTRPASNVDRRTPFGSENWKCGMHTSVKCVVMPELEYKERLRRLDLLLLHGRGITDLTTFYKMKCGMYIAVILIFV